MAKKKAIKPPPPKSARDGYVDNVRDALEDADAMSKDEYIDALETIVDEVVSLLEAARATR
jgi:hypothetical protein